MSITQTELAESVEDATSVIVVPAHRLTRPGNNGSGIAPYPGQKALGNEARKGLASVKPATRTRSNRVDRPIYYPTGDGKPMAESTEHKECAVYTEHAAKVSTAHRRNVYVAGNDFLYYEKGNPRKRVSPDVYLVLDIPNHKRPYYKIWEEGKAPDVIWEFTSPGTKKEDTDTKYKLYERLGVQEYFLFDPKNEYLKPRLQGYTLVDGKYQPMEMDEEGRLHSTLTDMILYPDGELLRAIHPVTGEMILNQDEAAEYTAQVVARLEQEHMRVEQERERAEQERERAEQEQLKAEQAQEREQQERLRAEQESAKAEQAEAEMTRLRAELERLRATMVSGKE